MKHIRKKIVAAVLCAALCLALAGCTPAGEAYPVSLGGVNITVGETTVGALLDAGYTIRALDENGVMGDVDAAAQLNANSYYSGLYLAKDGVNCAGLEVTGGRGRCRCPAARLPGCTWPPPRVTRWRAPPLTAWALTG